MNIEEEKYYLTKNALPVLISIFIHSILVLLLNNLIINPDDEKKVNYITLEEIKSLPDQIPSKNPGISNRKLIRNTEIQQPMDEEVIPLAELNYGQDSLKQVIYFMAHINNLVDKMPSNRIRNNDEKSPGSYFYEEGMIDSCAQYSLAVRKEILPQINIVKPQWGISADMLPYNSSFERHPRIFSSYRSPVRMIEFRIPVGSILDIFK